MDHQLNELENTFIEEYESAILLLSYNKYKSVTILLSKALFALTDYLIFKKYQKLPKNHSEKFRILKEKEEKLYVLIDEIWSTYTDSYSKPALYDSINMLQNVIKNIVTENENISQKIKKIVEK
ncbi:MAG: hypothetical protein ABH824_06525 [Nanoarchaeota archaeon]|nr:hypothetical protein [Nanoarchaeota archaeon]MBU1632039.1 hypothetical protein [Nanoarchaeota archaeon]MBU1875953.1 hypothetical protein [Nanoarchaeota archaeon]